MKISVLASTKVGYTLPKEEAINFSGKSAGICYLPDTVEKLFDESDEKTFKRAENNIRMGHHSVFGHTYYNLLLEDVPKILAMVLNNEKVYNTSEKSARYTRMMPSEREKALYEKWIDIFKKLIVEKYPNIKPKYAEKLAMENARYLISVFTPATTLEYTVSFSQLNYIVNWAKDYIENTPDNDFSQKMKEVFKEFLSSLEKYDLEVEGLSSKIKNRKFSIFAERKNRIEEFGENYSTNYLASFAQLAQAQRHRTLNYEMIVPQNAMYYIPPIIINTQYEYEWLKDISSLDDLFPQGMLVSVNERGTIENFVLKCTERLCGAAQLEIARQTKSTMNKYLKAVKDKPVLYEYLLPYSKGARCTFSGWKCESPCMFGAKNALNRII